MQTTVFGETTFDHNYYLSERIILFTGEKHFAGASWRKLNILLQEKFVFPTIGREELNLSISPMALSVAEVGDFTREYGTYIGDLKVLFNKIVKITIDFKKRYIVSAKTKSKEEKYENNWFS